MTTTIEQRFTAFLADNPNFITDIEALADQLVAAGATSFGLKQIFEKMRWDHTIALTSKDFKLNNDYTSRAARLLIARRPDLADHIETRELKTA